MGEVPCVIQRRYVGDNGCLQSQGLAQASPETIITKVLPESPCVPGHPSQHP
jgi:hypothetical protein